MEAVLNFLRDPIWQSLGAVIALIAIAASFYIVFLQKTRKQLSYTILAQADLVTVSREIAGKLQVLYDGLPVRRVKLVIIKIINDGNVEVRSEDFESPIHFDFGEDATILGTPEVINAFPRSLQPEFTIVGNQVFMAPTLINRGDRFTIKFLIAESMRKIDVSARIAGIRELRIYEEKEHPPAIKQLILGIIFAFIGGLLATSLWYNLPPIVVLIWTVLKLLIFRIFDTAGGPLHH